MSETVRQADKEYTYRDLDKEEMTASEKRNTTRLGRLGTYDGTSNHDALPNRGIDKTQIELDTRYDPEDDNSTDFGVVKDETDDATVGTIAGRIDLADKWDWADEEFTKRQAVEMLDEKAEEVYNRLVGSSESQRAQANKHLAKLAIKRASITGESVEDLMERPPYMGLK